MTRIGADQLVYLLSEMMQAKREAELKAEREANHLAKVIQFPTTKDRE